MNVVITGSTRGIGYGLAEEFIKAGHSVLINSRDRIQCGLVSAKFLSKYPDAIIHIYSCDVTCFNSVERMFWEANRYFGSVDIWINNAGMNQNCIPIEEQTINNISEVIDLNIKGTVYGTKVALKGMSQTGGSIYNMEGFGSNDMMRDNMSIYGLSKRAVTYFTRSISKEYKKSNLNICLLNPGMVMTDLLLSPKPKNMKIINILADKVETVTPYLVKKILSNKKNGQSIEWLTKRKALSRFILQPIRRRDITTNID